MDCVECRKNRDDLMRELHYENMKKCEEAYQDGYNKALEDFVENISLPMTEEQIGEILEQLKR